MTWPEAFGALAAGVAVLWAALLACNKARCSRESAFVAETIALVAFVVYVFSVALYASVT